MSDEDKMITRYLREKVELSFEGKLVFRPRGTYNEPMWGIETICTTSGVVKFEEIPEDVARRLARWIATGDDIRHTHKWGEKGIGREAQWFIDRNESDLSVYDNYPEAARRCAYWMRCEADRLEEMASEQVTELRERSKHLEEMAFKEILKGG